jgi:hypothetical protein
MEDKYCMVVDVLGFREIVMKDSTGRSVTEWVQLTRRATAQDGIEDHNLISDTLFVEASPDATGLRGLIKAAQILLEQGVKKQLLIRGAIVRGAVNWERQVQHGEAIIRAHELEEIQDWVGVVCDGVDEDIKCMYREKLLIKYPVPLKKGQYVHLNAVRWKVPNGDELISASTRCEGSDVLNKEWGAVRKIENTQLFGMYMRATAIEKSNTEEYGGGTRLSPVEKYLLQQQPPTKVLPATTTSNDIALCSAIADTFGIPFPYLLPPVVYPLYVQVNIAGGSLINRTSTTKVHYEWNLLSGDLLVGVHSESLLETDNIAFLEALQAHAAQINKQTNSVVEAGRWGSGWTRIHIRIPNVPPNRATATIVHTATSLMKRFIEATWPTVQKFVHE